MGENEERKFLEAIFGKQEIASVKMPSEVLARMLEKLKAVLDTLTYRQREILKLGYGLGDGYIYTFEEVGVVFKITPERVRQIEAQAIRKLHHPIRLRMLEGIMDAPPSTSSTKGKQES